jgi:RHS repeat-associated protein
MGQCAPAEPASLSTERPGTSAGNPIDLLTGNKLVLAQDISMQAGPLALQFGRQYQSAFVGLTEGVLGPGWRHSFETRAFIAAESVQILQADGTRRHFKRSNPTVNLCQAGSPLDGQLQRNAAGWLWTWPSGRLVQFDGEGRLTSIQERSGERLDFEFDAQHRLHQVRDRFGQSLRLRYSEDSGLLEAVDGPEALVRFRYSQGRLIEAYRAENNMISREVYRYEDARHPLLLTSVWVNDQRHKVFAYDELGRAILSADGALNDRIVVRYVDSASNRGVHVAQARDARGQEQQITSEVNQGVRRLKEHRVRACMECPERTLRFNYDARGLWHAVFEKQQAGRWIALQSVTRDPQGRIEKLQHPQRHVQGLTARYGDYNDLLGLEAPSQAPGQTQSLLLERGARGEILRAQRSGFRPALPAPLSAIIDPRLRAFWTKPAPVQAELQFTYQLFSGVLRLIEVSNPVEPGAAVKLRWSASGASLVALEQLGQRVLAPAQAFDAAWWIEAYWSESTLKAADAARLIGPAGSVWSLHDDLGRQWAQGSAIHGWQLKQHDGANRVTDQWRANADHVNWTYSNDGLVQTQSVRVEGQPLQVTRWRYRAGRVVQVDHPSGQILLERDAQGRITAEQHHAIGASHAPVTWRMSIRRDAQGRLQAKSLPDGSWVLVQRDAAGKVLGFERTQFNALWLQTLMPTQKLVAQSTMTREDGLHALPSLFAGDKQRRPWTHGFDGLGRLSQSTSGHYTLRYDYDWRGLRLRRSLDHPWGAQHSITFHDQNRVRVGQWDGAGRLHQQFVWWGTRPIAWIVGKQPSTVRMQGPWRDALEITCLLFRKLPWCRSDSVISIDANQFMAPRALLDHQGRRLTEAKVNGAQLEMHEAGQWWDRETGLLYNDQRYLDPNSRRYLTPDPLGFPDGPDPWGFGGGRPVRGIDPTGLVLFAFDGTGNTVESQTNIHWLADAYDDNAPILDPRGRVLTNSDKPYYIQGPGTGWVPDGAISFSLRWRINSQLYALDRYVRERWRNDMRADPQRYGASNPLIIPIDIIGFSRGAAMARDFAREVNKRQQDGYYQRDVFYLRDDDPRRFCVGLQLRFMGLFDTVLSSTFNHIDLEIEPNVQTVAHAVAVNEHRALFPLESIFSSASQTSSSARRIEAGFLGAHSDIGGGYAGTLPGSDGGDLSDIALAWMWDQAAAAGVKLRPLRPAQQVVSNPIVHSELQLKLWTAIQDTIKAKDRVVQFSSGPAIPMHQFRPSSGIDFATSQEFIHWEPIVIGNQAGMVDALAYRQWMARQLSSPTLRGVQ